MSKLDAFLKPRDKNKTITLRPTAVNAETGDRVQLEIVAYTSQSDVYMKAKQEAMRRILREPETSQFDATAQMMADITVSCSFEGEALTAEQIAQLYANQPAIVQHIDQETVADLVFIVPESKSSSNGAKSDSGSGKKSTQKTRKASPEKNTTND